MVVQRITIIIRARSVNRCQVSAINMVVPNLGFRGTADFVLSSKGSKINHLNNSHQYTCSALLPQIMQIRIF